MQVTAKKSTPTVYVLGIVEHILIHEDSINPGSMQTVVRTANMYFCEALLEIPVILPHTGVQSCSTIV